MVNFGMATPLQGLIDSDSIFYRFGRETFHEATKLAHGAELSQIDWSKFKYMIFDVPRNEGNYSERYAQLGASLSIILAKLVVLNYLICLEKHFGDKEHPYIEVAKKQECTGMQHLDSFFQDILDHGGEGVILRDPQAPYHPGRSRGFLKHKVP